MKEYIKANIDEKNVTSDWIFDYVLDDRNDISVSTRIPSDKGNSFIHLLQQQTIVTWINYITSCWKISMMIVL